MVQKYIQSTMIDYAEERLSTMNMTVFEIISELIFEYQQSFSKLFKKKIQTRLESRNFFIEIHRKFDYLVFLKFN